MKMKFLFFLPVCLFFLAGCSTPEKTVTPSQEAQQSTVEVQLEKDYIQAGVFIQTMDILNKKYVDQKKVGYSQLFDAALHGMVTSLDPYSDYEPPKTFTDNQNRRIGELCGIGIVIAKPVNKYLYVVNVVENSPADKAQIKPGDNISAINGKELKKLNLYQCQKLLQGAAGTKVTLTLVSSGKMFRKTLVRKKIITPSVAAAKVIDKNTGYIKITSFTLHTHNEFQKALKKLKKENVSGLIIDLRNNTGGHVKTTVLTLSQLLLPGKTLLIASQRDQNKKEIIRSAKLKNITPETELPIVLLVNNFTASSAEIFSGALRDNKRAVLVGTRTFGKGTLLHIIRLANGGALRFASGRYITPSGKIIEGRGLQPDHKVILPLLQMHRLTLQGRRYPGIVRPKIKNAVTDKQLQKALDILTQKTSSPTPDTPKNAK